MRLTFGKYKGLLIEQVVDLRYLEWNLEKNKNLSKDQGEAIAKQVEKLQPLKDKLSIYQKAKYSEHYRY